MMVYDCFTYDGEKDCLKIRCEELLPLNITHILVHSTYTFTGKLRLAPYSMDDYSEFIKYNIISCLIEDMPNDGNAWNNEIFQRNKILYILEKIGAKDDDIIIISDADEIPSCEAVKSYKPEMGLTALRMDVFWYKLNYLAERQTWTHPKIMTFGYLKNTTPNEVRGSGFPSEIPNAGWHFSYLGDANYIVKKLESFSHIEYDTTPFKDKKEITRKIENGLSLWGASQFEYVPIDETFPKYVYENQKKLKHLIKQI